MIKQMILYFIASHMHDKAGAPDCEPPAIRSSYKLILEFADALFRFLVPVRRIDDGVRYPARAIGRAHGDSNVAADVPRHASRGTRAIGLENRIISGEWISIRTMHGTIGCKQVRERFVFLMIAVISKVEHEPFAGPFDRECIHYRLHSGFDASSAPSTSALSFLNEIPASILPIPANVPKTQSVPAITRSRPTISANWQMRCATNSGCST